MVLAVVLAALCAGVPAAAGAKRANCSSGRTFAIDKHVRVFGIDPDRHDGFGYQYSYHAYACLRADGKVRSLGLWESGGEGFDEIGPYHFAVGGRFAAFDFSECGRTDCAESFVKVVDVRTGKSRHAPLAPPGAGKITDLVVKRNGSVAWIRGFAGGAARVERLDSRGHAVLERSPDVGPTSLRLAGSSLHWTSAGTDRSATLK
jgi:hypothetical protein